MEASEKASKESLRNSLTQEIQTLAEEKYNDDILAEFQTTKDIFEERPAFQEMKKKRFQKSMGLGGDSKETDSDQKQKKIEDQGEYVNTDNLKDGQFYMHGKPIYFAKNSLSMFPNKSKFRQFFVWVITWKYFDIFIIFNIMLNSIFLGMFDYGDLENKGWRNQLVERSETYFTICFSFEAAAKIIGMGLIMGKGSYLHDAWNWLDFIVVVTSLLTVIPSMKNISGLRTFRLFRPLRSLTALPSMRLLVGTLLASVSQLGGILGLATFFFLIFAILGVSLWSGLIHYKCRLTPEPVDGDWLADPIDQRICGFRECPSDQICGSLLDAYDQGYDLSQVQDLYRDTMLKEQNFGVTNFDNIGAAFLTIFQCITMEGWSRVMYMMQDAYSYWFSAAYFVLCVILCAFFLLNLTIAVMLKKYEELDKNEAGSKHKTELRHFGDLAGLPKKLTEFIVNQENIGISVNHKSQQRIKKSLKDRFISGMCWSYIKIPDDERYQRRLYRLSYQIVCMPAFNTFILLIILTNTVLLALDRYPPMDQEMKDILDIINVVFTILFTLESGLKLIGLGTKGFFIDKFNIFDGIVVIISLVELGFSDEGSGVSALRAFRLFRIFKIFKMGDLRVLLDSIVFTLTTIGNYVILLVLFIYVYSLLGMQIFALNYKFDDHGQLDLENGKLPRANFDTLVWAFVTIFQVLIGDGWNDVMYLSMEAIGWPISLYYINLILFGNVIMLNLFLAILLGNFDRARAFMMKKKIFEAFAKQRGKIQLKDAVDNILGDLSEHIKDTIILKSKREKEIYEKPLLKSQTSSKKMLDIQEESKQKRDSNEIIEEDEQESLDFQEDDQEYEEEEEEEEIDIQIEEGIDKLNSQRKNLKVIRIEVIYSYEDYVPKDYSENQHENDEEFQEFFGPISPSGKNSSEQEQPKVEDKKEFEIVPIVKRDGYFNEQNNEELINDNSKMDLLPEPNDFPSQMKDQIQYNGKEYQTLNDQSSRVIEDDIDKNLSPQQKQFQKSPKGSGDANEKNGILKNNALQASIKRQKSQVKFKNNMKGKKEESSIETKQSKLRCCARLSQNSLFIFSTSSKIRIFCMKMVCPEQITGVDSSMAQSMNFSQEYAPEKSQIREIEIMKQNYNAIYGSQNEDLALRKMETKTIPSQKRKISLQKVFDTSVVLLILFSSLLLCVDTPLNDPDGTLAVVLGIVDAVFTFLFLIEAVIKIVALGFFTSSLKQVGQTKPSSYISNAWNILDFFVVSASLVDFGVTNLSSYDLGSLQSLKAFRALRALRPLRMISRNEGLRLVVNALFASIPSMTNVLLVCGLFIIIFAIMGINFFAGRMRYCDPETLPEGISIDMIDTKEDCLSYGGQWKNHVSNFDNIFNAMLTLFEMMTTEGWLNVMYQGVDQTGIEMQPKENNNWLWVFYFIGFMVVGSMFVINLFVGVVIDNFNKIKASEELGNIFVTETQKDWIEIQRLMMRKKLKFKIEIPNTKHRKMFYWLVNTKVFEYFITFCIFLNTVVMSMKQVLQVLILRFHGMTQQYEEILEYSNYFFAVVFNFECMFKLLGLGKTYFYSTWNNFDLIIVIGTDLGLLMRFIKLGFDISTAATVVRGFRIMRIFRLVSSIFNTQIRSSRGMRIILDTLVHILPQITNVMSLIFLLFFIYSALGINVFSGIKYQSEYNEYNNFRSFGNAFLVLMRCMTGEEWNLVMHEVAHVEGCVDEQSYADQMRDGINGCGNMMAYPYFISFMILISMVIMNLSVAAVIEGLEEARKENTGIVDGDHLNILIDIWRDYDPKATGFIKNHNLAFLLYELPPPLGIDNPEYDFSESHGNESKDGMKSIVGKNELYIINEEKRIFLRKKDAMKMLNYYQIPVYNDNRVHFKDVAKALVKKIFKDNDMNCALKGNVKNKLGKQWEKKFGALKRNEKVAITDMNGAVSKFYSSQVEAGNIIMNWIMQVLMSNDYRKRRADRKTNPIPQKITPHPKQQGKEEPDAQQTITKAHHGKFVNEDTLREMVFGDEKEKIDDRNSHDEDDDRQWIQGKLVITEDTEDKEGIEEEEKQPITHESQRSTQRNSLKNFKYNLKPSSPANSSKESQRGRSSSRNDN